MVNSSPWTTISFTCSFFICWTSWFRLINSPSSWGVLLKREAIADTAKRIRRNNPTCFSNLFFSSDDFFLIAFKERETRSFSMLIILALTFSPILTMSWGLFTKPQSSSEIWIRPSRFFSPKEIKAPKSASPVISPSTMSSTLYFSRFCFVFSSSSNFSERINFSSCWSIFKIFILRVSPTNSFSFSRISDFSAFWTRGKCSIANWEAGMKAGISSIFVSNPPRLAPKTVTSIASFSSLAFWRRSQVLLRIAFLTEISL